MFENLQNTNFLFDYVMANPISSVSKRVGLLLILLQIWNLTEYDN